MALVPILVIGIPVALLLALLFQALDRFEARTAHVLQEGSEQLAAGVAREIERELKAPLFNFLEQVDHVAVRQMDLDRVASDLRANRDEARLARTFFVWSRVGAAPDAPEGEVLFYDLQDLETPPPSEIALSGFWRDPSLSAQLVSKVKEFAVLGSSYGLLYETLQGEPQDIVYHLLFDLPESNNLVAFMGFTARTDDIVHSAFPSLVSEVRGRSSAGTDGESASVSLLDENGKEVFRTGPSLLERFEHEVEFPFFFFDVDLIKSFRWFTPDVRYWKVRTGYPDGAATEIARRQVNQQRTLLMLVAFVAVVGLLLTVRATVRETRLAELRTDFISSVSHDLKTPLASVKMFSELLRTGRVQSPEKTGQYLEIIGRETARLEQIVEGILDFQRMESGGSRYQLEAVDLGPLAADVVASFDPQLTQEGFQVEIETAEGVVVTGNHPALVQVLRNLVSNAIKYSPEEKLLRLKVYEEDGFGVVEVTDRGAGIPSREQRRVFKKFYRLVPAEMEAATGTGIGLSIVAHVVRALRGKVSLTSRPGQGSTFRVAIPVAQATAHEDHPDR
jgi:two-component system phosphate regulon sensor histidine kinase PhoR